MLHLHPRLLAVTAAAGLALAWSPAQALACPVAPHAPTANAITVTSTGDNYRVAGHLKPGTATIRWVNADDEWHMMTLGRLKRGVTVHKMVAALSQGEQAAKALLADGPDAAYGSPAVLSAHQSETVTMEHLRPGTYVMICFMAEPNGTTHWQLGMVRTIQVRGATDTESVSDEGTIAVDDDGITLPVGFDGRGTYAVRDTGTRPHNFSLAHLDHGVSLADFVGSVGQAMSTGGEPTGGELVSGIDLLAPGQRAYLTLHLPAGRYGYLSVQDLTGPGLPPQSGVIDLP